MARIEQIQNTPKQKNHSFFRGIAKVVKTLLRLPFKITIRALIIIAALVIFVEVCRTGIISVPLLTPLVFREPQPIRNVEPGTMSDQLLMFRLQERLKNPSQPHAVSTITESEMTALLSTYRTSHPAPFSSAQIAITPQHIEFFGTMSSNSRVKITAWIIPLISSGKPVAKIDRAWIGDVAAPQWMLSQSVIEFFTTSGFNAMMPKLPLTKLSLKEEAMNITL